MSCPNPATYVSMLNKTNNAYLNFTFFRDVGLRCDDHTPTVECTIEVVQREDDETARIVVAAVVGSVGSAILTLLIVGLCSKGRSNPGLSPYGGHRPCAYQGLAPFQHGAVMGHGTA